MRIIELGGREIKIAGTPMTPYLYKKEFEQSLSGDLADMSRMEYDPSAFDDINLLQMVWAMEKTVSPKDMKPFVDWLAEFEWLDLGEDVIEDIMEEAMRATFRDKPKKSE